MNRLWLCFMSVVVFIRGKYFYWSSERHSEDRTLSLPDYALLAALFQLICHTNPGTVKGM